MKYMFFISVIVFAGCSSSEKANKAYNAKEDAIFNKWINQPKSLLIKQWGVPDSSMSDGKRGEILIYKERVDYKSVMNGNYTGKQYSFRKEMFVNADSMIYYWKAWRKK